MWYLINLIVFIIYGILFSLSHIENKNRLFLGVAFVHIGLFHAFRDPIMYSDNEGYIEAFELIKDSCFLEVFDPLNTSIFPANMWEKGYVCYNWIIGQISSNPEILFISSSLIIVGCLLLAVQKMSVIPFISVLIYLLYPALFYQSQYVLRQHMAMAIMFVAISNSDNKRIFFILWILSCAFHSSAIIFAVYPIIYGFVDKGSNIKKILAISVIFTIAMRIALPYVLQLFPRYQSTEIENRGIVPLFFVGITFLAHFCNGSYSRISSKLELGVLSFLLFGLIICMVSLGVPGAGRLTNYAVSCLPFAVPLLFRYKAQIKSNRYVKVGFTLLFLASTLFFLVKTVYNFEYKFFWL